jgi:hypothetical protein
MVLGVERKLGSDILNRCLDEQESDMPEMLLIESMVGFPHGLKAEVQAQLCELHLQIV